MKNKVKLKGKLRLILQITLILGVLLAGVDIWVYTIDVKAGIVLTGYVAFYLIVAVLVYQFNGPILVDELISFATQYGQIQKRLLRDLDLPHALLDENGRIIWTNKAFEKVAEKEKGYQKSITSIFSSITKDKFPGEADETEVQFSYREQEFTARMKKIPLTEMVANSDLLESDEV